MVVEVNLTMLLVLATMWVGASIAPMIPIFTDALFSFIGKSQALPTTSYPKMIDIWLIATMMVPFLEIAMHRYILQICQGIIMYDQISAIDAAFRQSF